MSQYIEYFLDFLSSLGVVAIVGVVKLWRDNAKLAEKVKANEELRQAENKATNARLRKIDEMHLEGALAEIKTQLAHILTLLEGGKK